MNVTLDTIQEIAVYIIEYTQEYLLQDGESKNALVIALHGNLGAGKTTLTQHMAKLIGVTEDIQSPTFVIQKNYRINEPVFKEIMQMVHIDAYRLESADEIKRIGFSQLLKQKQTIILIEWPEQIEGAIPDDAIHIYIDHLGNESREVRMEHNGEDIRLTKESGK